MQDSLTQRLTEQLAQKLSKFVPAGTENLCAHWLIKGKIQLKVTAPRKTKLGDFRPAHLHKPHRISVNQDLDSLQFLITFTHEIAHAHNWDKHARKVTPHGQEWKSIYRNLLQNLLALNVLDSKTTDTLHKHSMNPKACSTSDTHLQDLKTTKEGTTLNNLKSGASFGINGRTFRAIRKLRKYWLCEEYPTGRHYRVLGTALIDIKEETAPI